ncbi:hypothetical protein DV735_g4310, partial [Chaetothyriales sp. CBS 134920]
MALLLSAAPYHLLSYGTLLGSEVFQTFIGGIVAFRTIPRPQFVTLQTALFPIYFSIQTVVPVILALTYPTERTAISTIPAGIHGVLDPQNRVRVLTPLAIILVSAATNKFYLQNQVVKTSQERKHQETRDGKQSHDPPAQSEALKALNRKFAALHGASSLVNLIALMATIWYGFTLAERLT